MFFLLLKETRPLRFFGAIAMTLAIFALVLGVPVVTEYFDTGLVRRFPTAILSASLMVIAALSGVCGLILDSVCRSRVELKRMFLLTQSTMPIQRP